jgi:hypothetical protein
MYRTLAVGLAVMVLVALDVMTSAALAQQASGDDDFHAGLHISDKATATQTGLPYYPGSIRRRDSDNESPGISFGMSFGSFGIKVVAIKYSSADPSAKVLEFYRAALAQYGPVLDCSTSAATTKETKGDDPVTCDKDDVKRGQVTLKVGQDDNQRAVSVKQVGDSTHFELVRVRVKGDD